MIWTKELGWQLRCDICDTIFADDIPHFDRNEALQFYSNKFQQTRKLLKKVEEVKHGSS
ncbi:MAG: hypothetical protein NC548_12825 [Lachnospiraceae bacterium]|nr:hypothetical protein [Lachnospiraceae bacterium]MCM1230726.1 hypothetical protein [Ruminococcus flavefaciens]